MSWIAWIIWTIYQNGAENIVFPVALLWNNGQLQRWMATWHIRIMKAVNTTKDKRGWSPVRILYLCGSAMTTYRANNNSLNTIPGHNMNDCVSRNHKRVFGYVPSVICKIIIIIKKLASNHLNIIKKKPRLSFPHSLYSMRQMQHGRSVMQFFSHQHHISQKLRCLAWRSLHP